MLPVALLRVAPLIAALHIVMAILPNGDVERSVFRDVPEGVQATVEHRSVENGEKLLHKTLLLRGRYGWRIEEEHRSILMATPGRPTGVVRRTYVLSAWVDATPNPNAPPTPTLAFQFYAPSREAAEALRDRLKDGLSTKR